MRRVRILTAAASMTLLAALPVAAHAAPAVSGEFDVPGVGNVPGQLTAGPDGNIWVALSGGDKKVAKVTPGGIVTAFDVSAMPLSATGLVTGPDGNLWATVNGGVVRFSPTDPDTGDTLFPVPAITDPRRIVVGADGNLWTASGDQVIRITTAGVATPSTVLGMAARGIAAGADGKLYIADFGGTRIVALTTADPSAPTFTATGGGPQEVAVAPTGLVAFGNPGAAPQHVGRFVPGGAVATVDVPNADPFGVTVGADGAFWFAQFAAGTLGRLAPDGAFAPLAGLSAGSGPRWITTGPGDTLWVSEETAKKIARITGVSAPPAPVPAPAPTPTPPGPVADVLAPQLSAFTGPRQLRFGKGGTFRLTVSEAATVTLRFERLVPGRRRGSACVAVTARNRKARRCTRALLAGTLSKRVSAGPVSVRFSGRFPGGKLAPGRYRVTPGARDAAGNRTTGKPVAVTVLAAH